MADTRPSTPSDKDIRKRRNVAARKFWFTVITLVTIGVPCVTLWFLGTLWDARHGGTLWASMWGLLGGFSLGVYLWQFILPHITVLVPQVQGMVTQDIFAHENVVYGPGLHPALPQEQKSERSHVPLDIITVTFRDPEVKTTTYPVDTKLGLVFRADITRLEQFINLDDSTVNNAFGKLGLGKVSQLFRNAPGDIATKAYTYVEKYLNTFFGIPSNDDEIRDDVILAYNPIKEPKEGVEKRKRYEEDFGIQVVTWITESIDPNAEVLRAMQTRGQVDQQLDTIASMYGIETDELREQMKGMIAKKGMTANELLMMMNNFANLSGRAEKQVISLEGVDLEGLARGVAEALGKK